MQVYRLRCRVTVICRRRRGCGAGVGGCGRWSRRLRAPPSHRLKTGLADAGATSFGDGDVAGVDAPRPAAWPAVAAVHSKSGTRTVGSQQPGDAFKLSSHGEGRTRCGYALGLRPAKCAPPIVLLPQSSRRFCRDGGVDVRSRSVPTPRRNRTPRAQLTQALARRAS